MINFDFIDSIDWDFSTSSHTFLTNNLHPYPAKFIPEIPNTFIRYLNKPGETIYDPFLGSGTTGLAAVSNGMNCIGNDVNELAILISRVKTSRLSPSQIQNITTFLNSIEKKIIKHLNANKSLEIPSIINLEKWFSEVVISELVLIRKYIFAIDDKKLKNFFLVALSGIIINVSWQDSDTRYVRVPKNIKPLDTFRKFKLQALKMQKLIKESNKLLVGNSKFLLADTRYNINFRTNSADLSITSPPYPNAYDYHLYHKYRLFWLEMDLNFLRKSEIGAHADYSKKNGHTEFDFFKDMKACFFNISRILKPNKFFIIVVGDSILKGKLIKNNELLKSVGKETSFKFIKEFSRNLNLNKKSFNPKIGNIKSETILIFQNAK